MLPLRFFFSLPAALLMPYAAVMPFADALRHYAFITDVAAAAMMMPL